MTRTTVMATFVVVVVAATATARADAPPPAIAIHQTSDRHADGFIFVAPKITSPTVTGPQGPEIVDDEGRPIWFLPLANGDQATDFRVQRYRGEPVLTWWQGQSHNGAGHGEGIDYIVDRSYRVIATLSAGNGLDADQHEFRLTPEGTALITIYHQVPYDLSSVGGPVNGQVLDGVVQELDVASGRVLFEWHSLDHVALEESHQPLPATGPYDYFHINAVNVDDDGNLLVSARHTWTIYNLDRRSGHVRWRLGGKHSDFALGDGVAFSWQHNPTAVGEHTLRIFDNANSGAGNAQPSRVIWVRLDPPKRTATLVRAFEHPEKLSAPSQGNAQALEDGDTFVGWGALGRISEFDRFGRLRFDASVPKGYDTYRAYRERWWGRPSTAPTATAARASDRRIAVHAVWNGATDVARWRVLGGGAAAALAPIATAEWNGLDTAIDVSGTPAFVQVVAEDRHGRVLGTSTILPVTP